MGSRQGARAWGLVFGGMGRWPRREEITWIGAWRGDMVSDRIGMVFPPQKWVLPRKTGTMIDTMTAIRLARIR
jgi:hypothetical protein